MDMEKPRIRNEKSSADSGGDHFPVICKLRTKLQNLRTTQIAIQHTPERTGTEGKIYWQCEKKTRGIK